MILKKIYLLNFRIFSKVEVNLHDEMSVFVGKNNIGKTALFSTVNIIKELLKNRCSPLEKIIDFISIDDIYKKNPQLPLLIKLEFDFNIEETEKFKKELKNLENLKEIGSIPPPPKYFREPDEYPDEPPDEPPDQYEYDMTPQGEDAFKFEILPKMKMKFIDDFSKIQLKFRLEPNFFTLFQDVILNKGLEKTLSTEEKKEYLKKTLFTLDIELDKKEISIESDLGEYIISFLEKCLTQNISSFPEIRKKPPDSEVVLPNLEFKDSGENLISNLFNLKTLDIPGFEEKFKEFQIIFNKIFPSLEFNVKKDTSNQNKAKIKIIDRNKSIELKINEVGTGIFEIMLILFRIIVSENKVIIIEEPEIHLHPLMQNHFFKILVKQSQRNIEIC